MPQKRIGAPIRSFCAPRRPPKSLFGCSFPKNFCLGEFVTANAFAALKASTRRTSRGVEERQKQIAMRSKKPQFIGTSAIRKKKQRTRARLKSLLDADFAKYRQALTRWRRGAAFTHKIKRSHCYFFPAVVIG
jgi:hypothetical protein